MSEPKEVVWADPAPMSLVALCVGVFPLCALKLGWIGPEAASGVLGWLIVGFLVQVIGAVIEGRRGNTLMMTVLAVFGGFFEGASAVCIIFSMGLGGDPELANGVAFLCLGVFLIPITYLMARMAWTMLPIVGVQSQ